MSGHSRWAQNSSAGSGNQGMQNRIPGSAMEEALSVAEKAVKIKGAYEWYEQPFIASTDGHHSSSSSSAPAARERRRERIAAPFASTWHGQGRGGQAWLIATAAFESWRWSSSHAPTDQRRGR